MSDEATTSPASDTTAPEGTTPQAPAEGTPAPEAPKPEAQTPPAEPDYESLLSKEDVLERLLQHPKAQQRIKSVRETDIEKRAAERVDTLLKERDAEYAAQHQRQQRMQDILEDLKAFDDDPTHPLAQRRRPQLEAELQQLREADAHQRVRSQLEPELRKHITKSERDALYTTIGRLVSEEDLLTQEEITALNPYGPKYQRDGGGAEWLRDVLDAAVNKRVAKLTQKQVAELAKKEAAALVEERLAQEREKAPMPPNLPPGGETLSDKDFLADFAMGKNHDFARAQRLMPK